jgi:hypothetical protein
MILFETSYLNYPVRETTSFFFLPFLAPSFPLELFILSGEDSLAISFIAFFPLAAR